MSEPSIVNDEVYKRLDGYAGLLTAEARRVKADRREVQGVLQVAYIEGYHQAEADFAAYRSRLFPAHDHPAGTQSLSCTVCNPNERNTP
jgi:hypothetical protein